MATDAKELERRADEALGRLGIPGKATVQGSVAKDTWLGGAGDIDLFLLLDPEVPAERMESVAESVGRHLLADPHKRYAQHPYLMGTFQGRMVDLVPAYRVAAASSRMSPVDRTPFHTEWVLATLDEAGRDQARLLKQWMKGTGTYGAQTAVGGFSGYLAEVLVARFGAFAAVVSWLAADARPRRVALGPDQVVDEVSPLVVVDPVDPARNCAAAVQDETLALAIEAARDYTVSPGFPFFFPTPPSAEPADALRNALHGKREAWVGLLLRPRTKRLDIVLPQFQKGARSVAAAMGQAGFPVLRIGCDAGPSGPSRPSSPPSPSGPGDGSDGESGTEVLLQWVAEGNELPASRLHRGPVAAAEANARRFREKWEGHPDAVGPVVVAEGHLQVELRVPQRTAPAWLAAHLARIPLGRHVADALPDAAVLLAPEEVPPRWATRVTEFILDRKPWRR